MTGELINLEFNPRVKQQLATTFVTQTSALLKVIQCRLRNGGRFGKLVWSEVDHEFR